MIGCSKKINSTDELEYLNPQQAKELILASRGTDLLLDSLLTIDTLTAKVLSQHESRKLSLNGLKNLDQGSADALSTASGMLCLDGLSSINRDIATTLSSTNCDDLTLNGISVINTDVAESLSKFHGKRLHLNGIANLDKEVARRLIKAKCYISLDGIRSITPDVAKELATTEGSISLSGIREMDKSTAANLSRWQGQNLDLGGLAVISSEVARELVKFGRYKIQKMNRGNKASNSNDSYCTLGSKTEIADKSRVILKGNPHIIIEDE